VITPQSIATWHSFFYRSQHIIGQDFIGLFVHAAGVEICAGDDDCHIERGNGYDFVAAIARYEERWIAFLAALE